jgi:EAL domain-containing protein (putative c-di-GMP-specific phosphodiesterase class I)/ActR/RegA family two-component response regulator
MRAVETTEGRGVPASSANQKGRVLIVDDDDPLREAYSELLRDEGYEVEAAADSNAAIDVLDLLQRSELDVVLSDIQMPGMSGVELLRAVRERDLDLPVVLMTGHPTVETAARAVEHGALRYLLKPVKMDALLRAVGDAVRLRKLARLKREAATQLGDGTLLLGDRAGLEAAFERALRTLWMAYQPIVWAAGDLYGYEALVRTTEASVPSGTALFAAAERLGLVHRLGRVVRNAVAGSLGATAGGLAVFVNVHASELTDETLYAAGADLSLAARRLVLEITERAALEDVPEARSRIAALKDLGFRIALDDLGAGYAGLTSFSVLEPHIVKLDMSLVRGVEREPLKRRLIESMIRVCKESGILVVAEGVETRTEHDVLVGLGCDLLQGYLIGRPGPLPPA